MEPSCPLEEFRRRREPPANPAVTRARTNGDHTAANVATPWRRRRNRASMAAQPYTLPSSLDVMLGSRNSSESRRDTDESLEPDPVTDEGFVDVPNPLDRVRVLRPEPRRYERDCKFCNTAKSPANFPGQRITQNCTCDQPYNMCLNCLQESIATDVENGMSDDIRCPECSAKLLLSDIHRWATRETLDRFIAARAEANPIFPANQIQPPHRQVPPNLQLRHRQLSQMVVNWLRQIARAGGYGEDDQEDQN